jgi:hypothetical protein
VTKRQADAFEDLLTLLARVPKHEIDAEDKREARNKARRKKPKRAKPGAIIPESKAG